MMRKIIERLLFAVQEPALYYGGDGRALAVVATEDLRAAVSQLKAQAWQPIESCTVLSKPGAERLAILVHGPDVGTVRGYVIDYGDGTRHVAAEGFQGEWKITHWMPLPDPPTGGVDGGARPASETERASKP